MSFIKEGSPNLDFVALTTEHLYTFLRSRLPPFVPDCTDLLSSSPALYCQRRARAYHIIHLVWWRDFSPALSSSFLVWTLHSFFALRYLTICTTNRLP